MAEPGADPDAGASAPAAHPRPSLATQPPDPKIQARIDLELYENALNGKPEEVQRLLSGNPRPNLEFKHPEWEDTALHAACGSSRSTLDSVMHLINAGAKLDTPDGTGDTSLHLAAVGEHLDIVQFLVSKAEDMEHFAYRVEDSQHLVDPVERKKYFVNLPNNSGQTALHYAAQTDKLDMIEFLIEAGASTTLRDSNGLTAALHACSWPPGTGAMRKLLEKDRTKINDQADGTDEGKKQTCLHRICAHPLYRDPCDDIEWLLNQGADPTIRDADGKTAWELFCEKWNGSGLVFGAIATFAVKELEHILDKEAEALKEANYEAQNNPSILLCNGTRFDIREGINHRSWLHVNGNNRLWINGLLHKLLKQRLDDQRIRLRIYHFVARHFLECRESADHLAFREPSCSFERLGTIQDETKDQVGDKIQAPRGPAKPELMSLVMPYFHSSLYSNVKQRGEEYSKFTEGLRYCCGSSSNIVSKKIFGLHLPLTLDEYCNPALSEKTLQDRNRDQVLVRHERYKKLDKKAKERQETRDGQIEKKQVEKERSMQEEKGEKEVPPPAKLLTVQQAWIWNINDNLITAFSENLLESYQVRKYSYLCKRGFSDRAVGVLLSFLVDTLDRPVMAGLSEPIFNVFEKSISTLSEQVNQYLEVLDVEAMQIKKEKQYFHEIGDIREELSMIKSVLFQQEEVWKEFVSGVWPEHWKDGRFITPSTEELLLGLWQVIARPQTQFTKFRRRLEKIDDDAQRVENSISKTLDLKAKHASIREAHSTAVMSSAVFGFTIITIIFTPLSFVVSLFALPIDRFQRHQIESRWTNETGMYPTNYVGKFIATTEIVSVTLTLVAMWLSIELGLKRGRNLKRLQEYVNRLWKSATEPKPSPTANVAQDSSVCATASDANAEKPANEPDQKVEETQWWRFGRRRRRQGNAC